METVYNVQWFEYQAQVDDLISQAIGCKSCCQFCNRKCELKQHISPQVRHSCDTVGHQLRVFGRGHKVSNLGKVFPSLGTCDKINSESPMLIDGQKTTWEMVLEQQMSNWRVNYKANDQKIKLKQQILEDFWKKVGPKYCADGQMEYIEKFNWESIFSNQKDTGVVVICLDESGQMQGAQWQNVVKEVKNLIEFMKFNHQNPSLIQLVIITFNGFATLRWDQPLSTPINANVFDFKNGDKNFGPSMKMGMDYIQKCVGQKETGKFYYFTDGGAAYPQQEMAYINNMIKINTAAYINDQGECKLQIFLISEERNNPTLLLIKEEFNRISKDNLGGEICQLITAIDTSKEGQLMIERFRYYS